MSTKLLETWSDCSQENVVVLSTGVEQVLCKRKTEIEMERQNQQEKEQLRMQERVAWNVGNNKKKVLRETSGMSEERVVGRDYSKVPYTKQLIKIDKEVKEVRNVREKYGKDTDSQMITEFLFYTRCLNKCSWETPRLEEQKIIQRIRVPVRKSIEGNRTL